MAVSDTPWSKFTAADYSVEQWHRACIAHDHEGSVTTKDQCKLPVREPDGTLNRAGVHAAQAALSGARGGVKLSFKERISASKALKGYYKQLGEKPPAPKKPSFLKHEDASGEPHKSLVIVALPRDGDLSRAVGSEEKHATVLYLGEDVPTEVAALVKASLQEYARLSAAGSFTETVSGIATLGDKGARVWMIDSNKGLSHLRERLLRNPAIRSLYDQVEQYPSYTPHVTIGYSAEGESALSDFEETQARIVRQISFDRIALWHGENHDSVWRLNDGYEDDELSEAAHSDPVDDFLAHYGINRDDVAPEVADNPSVMSFLESQGLELYHFGVKGMKWGVQRESSKRSHEKFRKALENDKDPTNVDHPVYSSDVPASSGMTMTNVHYQRYKTADNYGYTKYSDGHKSYVDLDVSAEMEFHIPYNGTSVAEHSDPVENFLEHFGIKGMRWGVRRQRGPAGTVSSNPNVVKELADGERARATLMTLKKGGMGSVSSSDLQHLIARMNLEKQYADFDKSKVGKGNRAIKKVLNYGGTMNDAIRFANSPAGRLLSRSLGQAPYGKYEMKVASLFDAPGQKKGKKGKDKDQNNP